MESFGKIQFLVVVFLCPLFCIGQNEELNSDSLKAIMLNRKAIQLHQAGLHVQALDTFFISLNVRKKLYGEQSYNLAATYLGLGVTYKSLGQLDKAIEYYRIAENNYALARKYPYENIANLYLNIGTVYRSKLDYKMALQYFEQALNISINNLKATPEVIAGINYNIAVIHYVTNNYDKTISLVKENIQNAYPEDQILYYELLAFTYQMKKDFSNAKQNYLNAIKLNTKLNGNEHINVALAYLNYSVFLISFHQIKEANDILQKAGKIILAKGQANGKIVSEYYKTIGYLESAKPVETQNLESFKAEKKQNLLNSVEQYKKALLALNFPENYHVNTIYQTNKLLSLLDCITLLKLIADNYSELSALEQINGKNVINEHLEQALNNYQTAGALIQQARKEISDDESKIQLTNLEYSTFYQIIKVAYTAFSVTNNNKYIDLAFQNAEKVKSSSVFERISGQFAVENSLVPDSLLEKENRLNNIITIYSEKLYEEKTKSQPDSVLINDYNNEIFKATRNREELNSFMEKQYKDYYELKYSNNMLSLSEIQKKLKDDQIILEYIFNETDSISELYTLVIGNRNVDFQKQETMPEFVKSVETMFQFMASDKFLFTKNEDSKRFCLASHHLFQKLVLPLKNQLQNKKITVVPDGKLSYLPFEAFLEDLPDTTKMIEFNQLSYLIKNYIINYSNSANLLFKQMSPQKKPGIKAIAFAPVYNEGQTIEVAHQKLPLVPLPGIQKEIKQISRIINIKAFNDEEATEENFRKYAEQFDILHLAMHAFINDSLPAFSSFAFTQTNTDDPTKNGLLNTADIYNLKLSAKLTVLSACNTGSGQLRKGEGIMSLARGFLYAGCPAIVMSLWEVEDESGTQIITSFYKNLKKGKTKDESLRMAKLEYLQSVNSRQAHPHYWLGFVNIGDNSPLFISHDYYFFILLIIALAIIGTDQALRIRKARKKRAL